jgi:hypothetical protein
MAASHQILPHQYELAQMVSKVQDYAIFLLDPQSYVMIWNARSPDQGGRFEALIQVVAELEKYWLEIVELPEAV